MNTSTSIISYKRTIKVKREALEALKDYPNERISCDYPFDFYHDSKCVLTFFTKETEDEHRAVCVMLTVEKESATTVDTYLNICIDSVKFEKAIEASAEVFLYDAATFWESDFFRNGQVTIGIRGTVKITSPNMKRYPFSAQFKITEQQLTTDNVIGSTWFKVSTNPDIEYSVVIYPNGNTEETRGCFQIFFHVNDEALKPVKVIVQFAIDSAEYGEGLSTVYDNNNGRGIVICSTEELFDKRNGYIVNEALDLKIDGVLVYTTVPTTILSCKEGVASSAFMRHRGKEFTLVVEGQPIKVHKKVLVAASPVFEAMFDSNMTEVREKKMIIIDFSYEVVNAALKLLYSGSVPRNFNLEQILELLQFADKYQIELIMNIVQDFLIKNLSPTNVCTVYNFTEPTVSAPKLLHACKSFIIKCSKESTHVPDLTSLGGSLLLQIFTETFKATLEAET